MIFAVLVFIYLFWCSTLRNKLWKFAYFRSNSITDYVAEAPVYLFTL